MHRIYTIGYSGWREPTDFYACIKGFGAVLWDIRFKPWSQRPDYRPQALTTAFGRRYALKGALLGNPGYKGDGPMRLANPEPAVLPALTILLDQPLVLLCGCKDHEECHREMAAEFLNDHLGCGVVHLYDGVKASFKV